MPSDVGTTPIPRDDNATHGEVALVRAPFGLRLINLFGVLVPFFGLIVAIALLWGTAFNWLYLAIMAFMYLFTGLGITVGFHRYFGHRSFKAPKPVGITLAILGSMAVEGPVLQWVANHRKHHQHSDQEGDPHSPHTHGAGFWNMLRGLYHAHMGWIFQAKTLVSVRDGFIGVPVKLNKYVKDLENDRWWRLLSITFPVWVLMGLLIPALLGLVFTGTWMGALLGFIWGGLVRILILHHVTWSVNSVCHIWGTKPFRSHDESRNNAIFGVLALGEGWHNNHHAFPASARHGLRWWQLDVSYIVILLMSKVGLASEVRVPAPARIQAKLKSSGDQPPAPARS